MDCPSASRRLTITAAPVHLIRTTTSAGCRVNTLSIGDQELRRGLTLFLVRADIVGRNGPFAAQQFTKSGAIGPVAKPISLDTTGTYDCRAVSVGDDMLIAGQPTERALCELRAQGVTVVVILRTPPEMATLA